MPPGGFYFFCPSAQDELQHFFMRAVGAATMPDGSKVPARPQPDSATDAHADYQHSDAQLAALSARAAAVAGRVALGAAKREGLEIKVGDMLRRPFEGGLLRCTAIGVRGNLAVRRLCSGGRVDGKARRGNWRRCWGPGGERRGRRAIFGQPRYRHPQHQVRKCCRAGLSLRNYCTDV